MYTMNLFRKKIDYHYKPLSEKTWEDFTQLFGERGASSGCWCMWSRLAKKKEFIDNRGEQNKLAMKKMVDSGKNTGLIGYDGDLPIAWYSLGPRADFPRLERTRTLYRVDDLPVWSIVCVFVTRKYRRCGVSQRIIRSAIDYASQQGVDHLEAYPADPEGETIAAFVETGFKSIYEQLGFEEIARRGKRPIMRYHTKAKS